MHPVEGEFDVAIVGGGVIGVACALELARRGVSVCVLERDRVGHACSFGNAGWLTPSVALPLAAPGQLLKALGWLFDAESPFYIRPRLDPALARWLWGFLRSSRQAPFARGARALIELCRWSVDAWEELARSEPEPFGFQRHGLLAVYESERSAQAGRRGAAWTQQFGIRHEAWSADEVRSREPAVCGPQAGGLFFPDDAHCEPYAAVQTLVAAASRLGVRFEEHAEVFDLATDGTGSILRTSRGFVHAREVVVAAGAWSGSLGRRLGIRLPMQGAKGYSLVVPRREPHPTRSIYLVERKIALNPHRTALRIAGTLELVGEDLSIDRRRAAAMIRGAAEMLDWVPEPDAEAQVWRGLRPCTPDGMPVIGRTRGAPHLWLATGHQMTGLKTAPGTGRLLAELLCGEAPSFDPDPFRADRF